MILEKDFIDALELAGIKEKSSVIESLSQSIKSQNFLKQLERYLTYDLPSLFQASISKKEFFKKYQSNYQLLSFLSVGTLLREEKKDSTFMLLSLRIEGVRELLHPHTFDISPFEVASLYHYVALLTKAVTLTFLHKINHSPFNELAITLSRATLLTKHLKTDVLHFYKEILDNFLNTIHPSLSIEFIGIPLLRKDFSENALGVKTLECNISSHSKEQQRLKFHSEQALVSKKLIEISSNIFKAHLQHKKCSLYKENQDLTYTFFNAFDNNRYKNPLRIPSLYLIQQIIPDLHTRTFETLN